MNILYLCTYYHRAMIFRDAMNYLELRGNHLMAFNAALIGEPIADKYKNIMDEKVIHSECYKQFDRYLYFRKQNKIYSSLTRSVDVNDYQLIHSHFLFNGGWAAYRIKKKYGIPYVLSVRSGDLNEFLRIPVFIPIARFLIKNSSGVLFLSGAYRDQLIKKCFPNNPSAIMNNSVIIPNGLEPFWLDNKATAKTLSVPSTVRLLSIGKINKNKNMEAVVKAAELLNQEGINATVTVIGQILDEEVREYLETNKLVRLVPYLTKEELIEYYRNSDVFVLPSFQETFGRVYAEAMSQAVPVIYTKGQGFDGIFPDGEIGYSVDPKSPENIAETIKSVMKNYEKISENCVKKVNQFNWEEIAEKLESFYSDAYKRFKEE